MLLLAFDFLIIAILSLAVVLILNKLIKLGRADKLNAALEEQKLSAELAAKASQINPEEINNNKAKVDETLSKLN